MKARPEQISRLYRTARLGVAGALMIAVVACCWPSAVFADTSPGKRTFYKFLNSRGTIVITNKPDSYRRMPGHVELEVKLAPINIPKRYRVPSLSKQSIEEEIPVLISLYANQYGVDENLVYAMIKQESGFDPKAVSKAGACGLMQLMPDTAAEMDIPRSRIFDPAHNIAGGVQYIAELIDLFDGNLRWALAGYNAGPSNVKKYGGIPPFKETQEYVENVLILASDFRMNGASKKRDAIRGQAKTYIVFFKSGLYQTVRRVTDNDPYYTVEYERYSRLIRKELVRKVVGPI